MIEQPHANFNMEPVQQPEMEPTQQPQSETSTPEQTQWQKAISIALIVLIVLVITAILVIVLGFLTGAAIKTIQWVISLL